MEMPAVMPAMFLSQFQRPPMAVVAACQTLTLEIGLLMGYPVGTTPGPALGGQAPFWVA
jgi:hypothetical protein